MKGRRQQVPSSTPSPTHRCQSWEWLCWIFHSPQGETTNRNWRCFLSIPSACLGAQRPGPSSRKGGEGHGGGGRDNTFEKAFGEETCPGGGTRGSRVSACTKPQASGDPGGCCQCVHSGPGPEEDPFLCSQLPFQTSSWELRRGGGSEAGGSTVPERFQQADSEILTGLSTSPAWHSLANVGHSCSSGVSWDTCPRQMGFWKSQHLVKCQSHLGISERWEAATEEAGEPR